MSSMLDTHRRFIYIFSVLVKMGCLGFLIVLDRTLLLLVLH